MTSSHSEKYERTAKNVAETQAYLNEVWEKEVRWVWKFAILNTIMFLAGVGYLYLSIKVPAATLYEPIGFGLCGLAIFLAVFLALGYRWEKKQHAQRSEGMLKLSRQ